jgi:hypothetical protein
MFLELILVFLGIPVGYLIAHLTRDELLEGRKWFLWLIGLGAFLGVFGFSVGREEIGFWGCFILIVSFVSYWKSFDRKFRKERFK